MKRITLSRGKYALVDDADYDWLNQWKWYAATNGHGNRYAVRGGDNEKITMHGTLLNLPRSHKKLVDHINGNGLDNRRCNLRICVPSENSKNRKSSVSGTSRFLGVSWCKRTKKWMASIQIQGKSLFLGRFIFEELAALAYDLAALRYHREFAHFNF